MNRCPEDHKIVVRGLPSGIEQSAVEAYFDRIGRVADIWIKDNGRGTFGFVGFESKSDFEEALRRDGADFEGHVLQIEAKGGPRGAAGGARNSRDANKVYVRGIGDVSDADVRGFFEKIGPVNDYFRRDGADFCFIGFENSTDHGRALRMNGEEISGKRITVEQKGGRAGRPEPRSDDRYPRRASRRRRSSTPRKARASRSPRRRPQRESRSPPRSKHERSRSPPRSKHERSRSVKRRRRSSS